MKPIYTLGIDVGSTASKCVILKDGKEIVSKSLIPVGAGTSGPKRAISEVLENCQLKKEDMSYILATGYGRNSIDFVDQQMSELSCHARGAAFLFENVHTVIDIGGQDAKVLRLGNDGNLVNFVMNDKCAAGTGRFLDVMARVLEVEIGQLAELGAKAKNHVEISSTCTVFAESEVISQLAMNTDRCDIIDGIHRSVAARVASLARRVGVEQSVVMTGGVAQNAGVLHALEKELNTKIETSPFAQYTGALGAALFAYQKCK
ncbi:MAG TPA: 2-hydroxyglutaryl-CoA dehydratase [Ruminococcaceae bacterium]|nr:2-hydroxyglutaryl-CoA dehydratase [Oscillospiraceae bacterium]